MGLVTKQLQVTTGLLFFVAAAHLSVCLYCQLNKLDYFIRVQASIASATAVFFALFPFFLHLSLYVSLSVSLSISPLSAPSARTSNSMVKYPGQCVALQRDSGSRYAGNRPGSKWRVIVEHTVCLHLDLSWTVLRGPYWGKTFPQGSWNMGPRSHFAPSEKPANTT